MIYQFHIIRFKDSLKISHFKTPSELDWSEFDQSLAGLRSQSTLLDDSFTKIEDTFNHLFRSLNQLIEELLHDEHIGKEIKSNLLEGIKEIDGQMSLLKTRSAEREESIQRQRDVVNGLHKDFCARIAQLPDCELAAADFAIELAMDIVFYCVPFLKAVEFLDEALVLSRYFLRKGSQLISNVRSYIRNRGTNGASEENLAEARQQVNAR